MLREPAQLAAELVARFRRRRPMRGGSLLVTIFGDAILPRGGAVALRSLIHLAAPFGLNERLVRTTSARLAQAGWLEARRSGRLSEYRLSPGGRERFAEATRRIYGTAAGGWSGRWTLVVLPAASAAERRRLRRELGWHGFGELAAGIYAHPQIAARSTRQQLQAVDIPAGALVFDAALTDPASASCLVGVGWDLADLAARYRRFVGRFEPVADSVGGRPPDPETAFVLRTLLIHEYRGLHLRDPLLPPRLLRADWPGVRAADLCAAIYACVAPASEAHLSSVAAGLDGALPPPGREMAERFATSLGGSTAGMS
jgi:phenylacetic acid degradation operon negative regulatory protein